MLVSTSAVVGLLVAQAVQSMENAFSHQLRSGTALEGAARASPHDSDRARDSRQTCFEATCAADCGRWTVG
jgi:hypothetical protein